jgi:hypothetical protein
MINFAQRPLPVADRLEILWWRLVVIVTRLLVRARNVLPMQPAAQVWALVAPVSAFLWVPLATGLAGAFMGLLCLIIIF